MRFLSSIGKQLIKLKEAELASEARTERAGLSRTTSIQVLKGLNSIPSLPVVDVVDSNGTSS